MATEISNGKQTVKLYHSVNRGKAMYQLAYYAGGRRVQKNFADKSEAKRVAKQILGELSNDAEAVEAMATPELESPNSGPASPRAELCLACGGGETRAGISQTRQGDSAGSGRFLP